MYSTLVRQVVTSIRARGAGNVFNRYPQSPMMASTSTSDAARLQRPFADRDDRDLLAVAAAGDEHAFAAIFRRHVGAIRGFIASRVGAEAAEDLVAETFVVAWKLCSRFDKRFSSARPWLYGIATKVLQRHHEIEHRWQRAIDAGTAIEEPQLDESGASAGTADPDLVRAIARLDIREREVLLLHALGEMKIVEVAAAVGISPVAARLRLHRARKQLIAEIEGAPDA